MAEITETPVVAELQLPASLSAKEEAERNVLLIPIAHLNVDAPNPLKTAGLSATETIHQAQTEVTAQATTEDPTKEAEVAPIPLLLDVHQMFKING